MSETTRAILNTVYENRQLIGALGALVALGVCVCVLANAWACSEPVARRKSPGARG